MLAAGHAKETYKYDDQGNQVETMSIRGRFGAAKQLTGACDDFVA